MHNRLLQYGPVYSNGNIQKPAPKYMRYDKSHASICKRKSPNRLLLT